MAVNDPIGDMITRIRNAQMRSKSKVSMPGSKQRERVLEVLKTEGFIRGYASVAHASGRSELEIELKYFDGEPVIREIARVSKPGRRVYASVKALAAHQQRARRRHRLHAQGRDGRPCRPRRQCRRRNPLHGVLMSRIGKRAVPVPSGVTANVEGQTVKVKGPKGALQAVLHDDVTVAMDKNAIKVEPRFETKRARSLWGTSRTQVANLVAGVTKGFEEKLEITGVGFRAAVQGKQLNLQLGFSHDVNYPIPQGISIATPKPTEIVVTGIDKQQVGQVAAEIRGYRRPEPYKGKGVRYAGEYIFRKEGKKK